MAGSGDVAIGNPDRWRVIERLRWYSGPAGPLTAEAYTERVGRAYAARTRAELDQVLADLPAVPPPWGGGPPIAGAPPAGTADPPPALGTDNRVVIGVLAGIAVVVIVGSAILFSLFWAFTGSGDDTAAQPADRRSVPTTMAEPASTSPEAPESEPATTTATTSPAELTPPTIPPVVLLVVGQDIQPGRYLATELTFSCYWERVSGPNGTLDEVIVNGLGTADLEGGGHLIVEILATDAGFRTQGCGEWRPFAPPAAPATTMGNGDWLVGSDIQAGTYRSTGPSGVLECAWERASDFTHDMTGDLVDYDFTADPAVVQVRAGERFTTDGCGTWTLE
ncbi:MAG: DUF1707 SHOCT-like domain-containing protein [Acidimicrobiales bacterium]